MASNNRSKEDGMANNNPDTDALIMWRVDPTGQFWRMDASAIGRGCMNVEAELLQRVKDWKIKQSTMRSNDQQQQSSDVNDDQSECEVLHEDVRDYLGSLSTKEAVELATNCLVDGIMKSRKQNRAFLAKDAKMTAQVEQGLRKRIQAVIIRSSNNNIGASGKRIPFIETV